MAIYSYKKENGDIVSGGYDYEDGYTPLLPEGYEYDSKNKEVIKKADYVAPEKTEKSTESSGVYGGNGNVYDTSYSSLVSQYMNPTPFSYDYENDPLYQNYLESYTRQGKTAMNDTLAQVSARTGGLASSYAQQAAQGTYNNYIQQAADKIPELYSMRYNEWLDQQNLLKNQISLAQDIDNTNYSRSRDTISDQRYADELAYSRSRDEIEDQRYADEWAYQKDQDAKDLAYKYYALNQSNASDRANYLASLGDYSGIKSLYGLSDPTSYEEYYKATGDSGILTEQEFAKRKNANSKQVGGYTDYQDYLTKNYNMFLSGNSVSQKAEAAQATLTAGYSAMADAFTTAKEKGLTDEDFYQYVENAGYKAGLTDAQIEEFFTKRGM